MPVYVCFNPRPLLLTGESVVFGYDLSIRGSFNPRPLLLTGESCFDLPNSFLIRAFQSTPVIANGRISLSVMSMRGCHLVSIHARYC